MSTPAKYFDGQTAGAHPVIIAVRGDKSVEVRGALDRIFLHGEFTFMPGIGRSPARLNLQGGGLIEVPFSPESAALITALSSSHDRFMAQSEARIINVVSITLAAVLFAALVYIFGIPRLGYVLAPLVPDGVKEAAGEQILATLDVMMFSPTSVEQSKQQVIQKTARNLAANAKFPHEIALITRELSIQNEGIVNAFSIFPRTMVITDALVKKLSVDEIEAVLAHELGHLAEDHGTQMVIRGSLTSVLTIALFGADPGAIQGIALALVDAQHSQGQEREADAYAADILRRLGKNPEALARALKKIGEGHSESKVEQYLSTHPLTSDRIQALRAE